MNKHWVALVLLLCLILPGSGAFAARVSDISSTKHNLSQSGPGTVLSTTESQICVFCHTPHAADNAQGPVPLWNKTLSGALYTPYDSNSLDAKQVQGVSAGQPLGSSKLCLSCHDGVMALGSVRVLRGQTNVTIGGGTGVTMPVGSGSMTGYTRLLGTDLTNDHPVSITYDAALSDRDGELRRPTMSTGFYGQVLNRWGTVFGARQQQDSYKPMLPLANTGASNAGQVQCTTCHDPHIKETNSGTTGTGEGNIKFLRANRFQRNVQPTSSYSANNDIVCLACHDKGMQGAGGGSYVYSAHANSLVATQLYKSAAATTRQFPKTGDAGITSDLPVWRASCLNCHDSHTVQGARRLLREGTDSTSSPKAGGFSAIEETCYQCHSSSGSSAVVYTANTAGAVPDIKTDFTTLSIKMPITNSPEVHDIGGNFSDSYVDCTGSTNKCGADFIERRSLLGSTVLSNRHTECTDCHNPHRVVRFKDFRGNPAGSLSGTSDASGTHTHTDDNVNIHNNIASGVLRGAWGVEPDYPDASFHSMPNSFTVKRGDPGSSVSAAVTDSYVTREYQICMKCHSNYGYPDDNVYPNSSNRPQLGAAGGTAANANGHSNFTSYTNQAKEFQAPIAHRVSVGSVSLGNNGGTGTAASNNNNHRSWHPVMAPTGRLARAGRWLAPWNESGTGSKAGRLGVQTMYCTDCHGSGTAAATAIPTNGENGSPWGPHGSNYNFLLKGDYSTSTGVGQASTGLCFKCHEYSSYGDNSSGNTTGFKTDKGDGHKVHRDRIKVGGSTNGLKCNWCHVAVPHGWKNRNLLVNLLDVGAEAGLASGTAVSYTNQVGYTNGPYYRSAFLRILSFPAPGVDWKTTNCNGGASDSSVMKTNCNAPP